MPDKEPIYEPQIQDRTERPRGVVPRNAQGVLLGLIALAMVVIIFFTSSPPKEPRPASPAFGPGPSGPSPATIDDFVNRMDDRAKKLAEAKAALDQEQQELVSRNTLTGRPVDAGGGYFQASPTGGYRTDLNSGPPVKTPAQMEREQRESQAPFASSIALSFRQKPTATSPPGSGGSASGATPKSSSILNLLNEDAILASAAAAQFGALSPTPPSAVPGNAVPHQTPIVAIAKEVNAVSGSGASVQTGKRYTLFEGSIIETALTNRLDATFSGPVICIVTTDVYSQNGRHLLIPRGSRVIGEVRQVDSFGQQRVAVSFHRLILPNEQSVSLDQFIGLNQIGSTGLRDQVNHHYFQMFGAAIAVGAISGLAQSNTRYGPDVTEVDVYRQGVGSSLAQSSMRILDRFVNVLPTFTIREGHRIKVYLAQDLELPEYSDEGN